MESIQQIAEEFIKETIAIDITRGITDALAAAGQLVGTFICRVMEHKFGEIDQALLETPSLRKDWVVEQRDISRELLTDQGLIQYSWRYYCSFANSMGSQLSRKMSATKQLAKFGYQINCQSFQKI